MSNKNLSNYEKVLEFNDSFGVSTNKIPQPNLFTTDPKLVQYRLDLITEEYEELKDAIKNHDFIENIDALADLLYVIYGSFTAYGIDADKAFDIVHRSNMSKLCKTEQEAKDTVEWYKQQHKQQQGRYDSPAYKYNGEYYVVYNESTKKILKSIYYTPAKFDSII
jgi:predicted HAD superfamily Cof-like phosphohydrolase